MSEYKIVFRKDRESASEEDRPTWEKGCPVFFEAVQVSRNVETGEAYLQTKVQNIGPDVIRSFKARLEVAFKDGSLAEYEAEPLDADIAPGASYVVKPVKLSRGDAVDASATVLTAAADGGEWISSGAAELLPHPKALNLPDAALREREIQLSIMGCSKASAAAPFAVEDSEDWSLCACGQPSVGLSRCPDCGLMLHGNEEIESEEYLSAEAEKRRVANEASAAVKAEKAAKKRKKVLKIGIPILAVALLCIGAWYAFVGLPNQKADEALAAAYESESAYPIDEWMSKEEWRQAGNDDYETVTALIMNHYGNMTEESKEKCVVLLARNAFANYVYQDAFGDKGTSAKWVEVETQETDYGTYKMTAKVCQNEDSDGSLVSWDFWYEMEFTPDLDNADAIIEGFERTDTELNFLL